jgi:putative ABC transport system ATP-binding protein
MPLDNRPLVQVNDVFKSYTVGDLQIPVLQGISFDVDPGEFVAIVGPSGNGKSTLLNMITGIDHPTAGQVIVNGQAVHTMSENQLAAWRGRDLGVVFQFFQLLPALSLLENIILPMDFVQRWPKAERKDRAMQLLSQFDLADQAHKLPSQVSGGQQQRAAIARALANDPPLIVADEPTGNLDATTSDQVFDQFSHLVDQGKTLIMVTHSRSLAARIPRTLEIRNGQLVRDETREMPGALPARAQPPASLAAVSEL